MRVLSLILVVLLGMLASASTAASRTAAPAAPHTTAPPLPPAAPALTRADLEAWLDGYMPYALGTGDVAGAVVVVVKDGQVLLEKGYGYADVARRQPVDPQRTLFRLGSVSKLFVWTAVMQQVEAGRLDLDADINRYLDFRIPPRDGKPITLRNLMTHTSGFEEQLKSLISADPKGLEPLGQHLKRWTPNRIFAPGTTPAYSNYGAALAGYIVERVSGQPLNDYLDQHVFAPLGMAHSSFRQPLPAPLLAGMSKGYALGSGDPKPYELVGLYPAGSTAATGDDVSRFMIAHLQDGAFNGAQILKPETARLMHTSAYTVLPGVNRMLLGFYEQNRNGRRVIGHGGDTQFFHSDLHLFLDEHVGLFVSMNSAGADRASGRIRTALYEGFTDRYFPAPAGEATGVDARTAAQHAAMMAGVYDNSRRPDSSFLSLVNLGNQTKVIANKDGTISVPDIKGLNGQPKRWREISPFLWQDVGGDERLSAEVKNGKVVRFTGSQLTPFETFLPAPAARSSAFLIPAMMAALGAVLITCLMWPVAAVVRRRYGGSFPLSGQAATAHRAVRGAAVAALAAVTAWVVLVLSMFSNFELLSPKLDGMLMTLHLVSVIVFPAAALAGLWNVWVVWTGKRSWFAKLWSVALALAFLVILWIAIAFKLIGFGLNY